MTATAGTAAAAIDGTQLAAGLRAGIYRLFAQTDHLNKINVFPVPDGDTGTNLAMTASAVLATLDRSPEPHAGALLVRVADAALDGARGNSGSILAQFLCGLADKAGPLPRLSTTEFASAATAGAAYARDAVSQPREGTMLTVLRDFAETLQTRTQTDLAADFTEAVASALVSVRASLAATTDQIEALRDAHVVDAGALGFVELIEGLAHYLETGDLGAPTTAPAHRADAETMADSEFTARVPQGSRDKHRYCTECHIAAEPGVLGLDLRRLREGLSALGTSLVVGGNKRKAKLHIHTDDPGRVFEFARTFGDLTGQKADDMFRQESAAHHRQGQRVAIVTDSAADIPEDLLESLGIHVVPLRIHFGSHSYLDKVTMAPTEFYRELAANPEHPKTSQPPPGDFRRMYEFLASHYESVVSIALSAQVSGTCNAATTAAQRIAPGPDGQRRVVVIDSHSASAGEGLVAIAAAECAKAGGSAAAVIATARDAAAHTRAFALLGCVDYAVKGGRVPAFARLLARWFHLGLILAANPDGRVTLGGVLWGHRQRRERFAMFVAKRIPPSDRPRLRLLIGHGNAVTEGQALAREITAALAGETPDATYVTDMGTAFGVHGGPGTLIVGIQRL